MLLLKSVLDNKGPHTSTTERIGNIVPQAVITAMQRLPLLFDHLIGSAEERKRNGDAERVRGLQPDIPGALSPNRGRRQAHDLVDVEIGASVPWRIVLKRVRKG